MSLQGLVAKGLVRGNLAKVVIELNKFSAEN